MPKGKGSLLESQMNIYTGFKMPGDTDPGTEVARSLKKLFILGTHGHKKLQDSVGLVLATSAVTVSCGFILL